MDIVSTQQLEMTARNLTVTDNVVGAQLAGVRAVTAMTKTQCSKIYEAVAISNLYFPCNYPNEFYSKSIQI